jgi:hypothetical protein
MRRRAARPLRQALLLAAEEKLALETVSRLPLATSRSSLLLTGPPETSTRRVKPLLKKAPLTGRGMAPGSATRSQ